MTGDVFFHGGIPGLAVGDVIAPPDVTGTSHRLSAHAPDHAPHGTRTDVVYVTTVQNIARFYAACYPDGALYRVEPEGIVGPDPDAPTCSMMCASALIVAVIRPRVVFAHRRFEEWLRLLDRSTVA